MPNTREKLIELLCDVIETDGCSGHCNFPPCYLVKACADHLIANGVTFQNRDTHWATEQAYKNGYEDGKKWIPVSERLPEPKENPVLVAYDGGVWMAWKYSAHWELPGTLKTNCVTHWMPLPEAPKGE